MADRFSEFETSSGGIWRICAIIDYATKYCLAITVTRTGRGPDAVACLRKAITEAERLCGDLRADRGVMDIMDADGEIIGQAPAPIAIVSDNGSCFRGEVFTAELTALNHGPKGDDPLLRHVRTRVKSPQTNGVVERFFGTLKYEHLFRCDIPDDALAVETNLFPPDLQHHPPAPGARRPHSATGVPRRARERAAAQGAALGGTPSRGGPRGRPGQTED